MIDDPDNGKNGDGKPANDLEKALEAFIDQANQQEPQPPTRHQKIKYYFNSPEHVLEVAGVVILFVYTVVTVLLWCDQNTANQINSQGYLRSNRAWVNITAKGVALDWSNFNSPVLQTSVTYENVGNSPALNVTVSALFEENSVYLNPEAVKKSA